jgi:hypothetical protein
VTRKEGVPVYIITGFLDAGKTRFIGEMLRDQGFSEGERTLIFRCEEGEEEYDPALLKKANTVVYDLVSPEDMDEKLIQLDKEIIPERIIFEYNATWTMERMYNAPKPEEWELAQIVTIIDASTFEMYLQNMRDFMTDGIKEADLILFNRCAENTPKGKFRRTAKALNSSARVYFENPDGTTDDGVENEDLPYDMSADPIAIPDEMFGIWYLDAMEHPARYDGKNLKFKVQAAYMKGMPNKTYVASRQAMTCCADDIGGIGFVCKTDNTLPTRGKYYEVVVKAERAMSPIHGREAIILVQKSIKAADKPKDEVVYFN